MFKLIVVCLFVSFGVNSVTSSPRRVPRSFPHRAYMFSGFYGNPSDYYQPGAMTAFLSGNSEDTYNPQVSTSSRREQNEAEPEATTIAEADIATPTPRRAPKKKPVPAPEDDYDAVFSGRNPFSYNTFFPVILGGYPGAKGRSGDEGGYPGAATAIANSFSTGKGGVASSHATAFGDPTLGGTLRNGFGTRRNGNSD